MSQSEAVNEMKLCGRIGVRLFLLNKTLCWFSPWELMKTDYDLVTDYYSFWIVNHKCKQIQICDTLALLARLVNTLLAKTIKPHREGFLKKETMIFPFETPHFLKHVWTWGDDMLKITGNVVFF